jgi:hypothetical protein
MCSSISVREPNRNPSRARYSQIGARIRARFASTRAPILPIAVDWTGGLTALDTTYLDSFRWEEG